MQINIRPVFLVAIALAAAAGWYWHTHSMSGTRVDTTNITPEGPIVISTNGGELGVATVTALEQFTRDTKSTFAGFELPLGTTHSYFQARATYRYHITMERRWPVAIEGKTAVVRAPKVEPTLPAAFDTATVEKYTVSGWARFDKSENLADLERTITGQLQSRAVSPQYDQIVKDAARVTVKAFVATWLLAGHKWGPEPEYRVIVLFPGETVESQMSNRRTDQRSGRGLNTEWPCSSPART